MDQLEAIVPAKYRWLILAGIVIAPMLGRAYHALTTGGGLSGIWRGIMLGTNVPKDVPTAAQPNTEASATFSAKIPAMAAGALMLLGMAGCATTSTVTVGADGTTTTNTVTILDIPKTTNAINAVVPVAVRLAVEKYPQAKPYFQDVAVAISIFATSTNSTFSPAELNAAITNTVNSSSVNADVLSAVDGAVALYQAYYGDALAAKLNFPVWLVPVLQSLSGAINAGLTN